MKFAGMLSVALLTGLSVAVLDITRLGPTRRVGGGRQKVSSAGPSPISDRPRIRGDEERSRTCLPGLPGGPWLPSLSTADRAASAP